MGKSLRDQGRKIESKKDHLKSTPFETTPAQTLMRAEMEAGVHKRTPVKLGAVLDEVVGPREVHTDIALDVINEHGQGLTTGFREWAIIQKMIEVGVARGYALAEAVLAEETPAS